MATLQQHLIDLLQQARDHPELDINQLASKFIKDMKLIQASKTHWRREYQQLIRTNDTALYRAILYIYYLQEVDEYRETIHSNSMGFSKVDADILGQCARTIISGQRLNDKQLAISRNKMGKYWQQIGGISSEDNIHIMARRALNNSKSN